MNVDVANSVSFIDNESADDQVGHGTHVAGIIAAEDNNRDVVGVAAGAEVIAVKVCNNIGCPEPALINGIDYVSHQADPQDIVNISIWNTQGIDPDFDDAVLNAANNGVRLALIAGNAGADANNYSPGRVNHPNIWTMSAYNDTDTCASFSNFGNPPVDYSGPGVDILSLWNDGGTNTTSGTSMAAPHIAGLLLVSGGGLDTDGLVSNDLDNDPDSIAVAEQPMSVTTGGPTVMHSGDQVGFHASVSFEEGPVSYQWYYRNDTSSPWIAGGTSQNYTHTWSNPGPGTMSAAVKIEVSSAGETATDMHSISIMPCERSGGNGIEPNVVIPCDE